MSLKKVNNLIRQGKLLDAYDAANLLSKNDPYFDIYTDKINEILKLINESGDEKKLIAHTSKKISNLLPNGMHLPTLEGLANDYSFIENLLADYLSQGRKYNIPVSVIIPVYNRNDMLGKTLAGLYHQNYPKNLMEIVVVDDGSTENTISVIKKYEKIFKELKYIRQPDKGYRLSAARNLGVRSSKHEHIIILDCDLIPTMNFVSEIMKYFHVHSKIAVMAHRKFVYAQSITDDDILSNISSLDSLPEVITENPTLKENIQDGVTTEWRYKIYKETDNLKKESYPFRCFASGHVGLTKTAIEDAGYYDEDFQQWGCEDLEFGYRLYNKGYYFIPSLSAIDLHQEPEKNKTIDREKDNIISKQMLSDRCPIPLWRKYRHGEIYTKPLVSIYMPVYNAEKYIIESVDSVLNQTYTDLELCICNDGSTDRTLAILEDNYSDNPRIRWVTQENKKILKARQTAINMCQGMYIGQLDADDILHPKAVEIMIKTLNNNPEIGCVYSNMNIIDENGEYVRPGYNWPAFSREKLLLDMIVHHFRMFRARDWHRTIGFSDKVLTAEDYDMFLKLAEVCKITKVDDFLYSYRQHDSNSSNINMKKYLVRMYHIISSLERMNLLEEWEPHFVDFKNNPRKISFKKNKSGNGAEQIINKLEQQLIQ